VSAAISVRAFANWNDDEIVKKFLENFVVPVQNELLHPRENIRSYTVNTTHIAALTSKRINLSPFTKGCRDGGASMRIHTNFFRGSAPTVGYQMLLARE